MNSCFISFLICITQMLFYESAACLHGRRSKLKGKYYGSLFLHYQPADMSIWKYDIEVRCICLQLILSMLFDVIRHNL